jgi:tetratricopeptide (TPR) repeat protein
MTLVYYVKQLSSYHSLFLLAGLTLFVMLLLTGLASADSCTPVQTPSILFSDERSDYVTSPYSFRYPFKTGIMTEMKMSLNRLLYEGAKDSPHQVVYSGECTGTQRIEFEMERALDEKQNQAYSVINNELTRLQENFDQAGLTSGVDTFLPLLLTFVASLPDDPDSIGDKFPIETAYERKSSLNDKNWLLLGLLENKGYNAGVVYYGLSIIPAVHGTGCDGKEGYLFIDIMGHTIGKRTTSYASVDPIAIIPFGSGTKQYQPETCIPDRDILSTLRASPSMNMHITEQVAEEVEEEVEEQITEQVAEKIEEKNNGAESELLTAVADDDLHSHTQYMNGDEQATISSLIQKIQEGDEEAWIWNNLGVKFIEQKRFSEAENAFNRALEIDPESVEALSNLAYLLGNKQKKFELAEEYINRALSLAPEDSLVWYQKGMLYYLMGNGTDAAYSFEQALMYDETLTDARVALDILSRLS